jgi:hypothetical protein
MIPLRKSTASQEVLLGPFLDDTDGKTAETALTIANTDIKIWKRGGTTETNKNSGGATHIASGRYYATLDATDTDTSGELIINVAVAGALPVRLVCHVYEAAVFDAFFAASAGGYSTLTAQQVWEYATRTLSAFGFTVSANVTQWNGGALPTIGTSTLTAQQVWEYATRTLSAFGFTVSANVTQWNGGALPSFPINFGSLLINGSGHISRVVLVDTTTTNTDMRGTDGAALATHWTSTRAGYLDSVVLATNSNQRTVQVTGSNHVAADIHELQAAVIKAQHFAAGAIDAAALAADAASEIASAVRTNLATELARLDVTVGSRLADASYTAPPSAATVADTILSRALTTAEATAGTISLCTLVLALTGKASVSGGVLTVYRSNGSTVHATIPVASDAAAEPIVGIG